MIGREVWGWRILALILIVLLVPTIPHLDEIESEWRDSFHGVEIPLVDDENQEPQTADQASDDQASDDQASDGQASGDQDGASAEANVELSEDEAEPESTEDDSSTEPIIENSSQRNWVLPATQVLALTFMMIMAVGLITSTATVILASEAARMGLLLAVLGPLIGITQRGEGGIFTRGRLLGFIEAHPSIHFSALRDALELGNGVTAHHIQILEKEGRIFSWMDGRIRRFASSGIDQKRLKELQSPITGMQIAIMQVLAQSGKVGIRSGELRAQLETSRQLLSYHMLQLGERKFVKSTGKGRAIRWSLLDKGKKHLDSAGHLVDI